VTVSIAAVAAAATEMTTRPLHVVLAGLGQPHAGIIRVRLHPVGVYQHSGTAHG
jgi:hypothetical protein